MAGAGVGFLGRRAARKAAFESLKGSGFVKQGVEWGSKRAQVIIRRAERGGYQGLRRRFLSASRSQRGAFGPGATAAAYKEAGAMLRRGKAFGAVQNIFLAAPAIGMGFSMLSDVDKLWEKNIPPPAVEITQTQQMFLPRQAYTQRHRAVQAIHQSRMTTRSALGNEAQFMHG